MLPDITSDVTSVAHKLHIDIRWRIYRIRQWSHISLFHVTSVPVTVYYCQILFLLNTFILRITKTPYYSIHTLPYTSIALPYRPIFNRLQAFFCLLIYKTSERKTFFFHICFTCNIRVCLLCAWLLSIFKLGKKTHSL